MSFAQPEWNAEYMSFAQPEWNAEYKAGPGCEGLPGEVKPWLAVARDIILNLLRKGAWSFQR
jgi:hypothetical protein